MYRNTVPGNLVHMQYAAALADPFDPFAIGCRVPDSYALPTAAYHIRTTFNCTSSAGGTFLSSFFANPCLTGMLGAGNITGATGFTQNNSVYYLLTPAVMQAQAMSFRVAAWGIRILAKDTAFAEKGRVYAAVVPCGGSSPPFEVLQNIPAVNGTQLSENIFGYDLGNLNPSAIQNLANCQSFSLQNLMTVGSYTMSVSASHHDQFRFRSLANNTNNQWSTTYVIGDATVVNTSSGQVPSTGLGWHDPTSLVGTSAVVIYATGMPPSTNEFDIDVIYHLEVTPNVFTNSTSSLVPSAMSSVPGDTSTLDRLNRAAKPYADRFRATAADLASSVGTHATQLSTRMAARTIPALTAAALRRLNQPRRDRLM